MNWNECFDYDPATGILRWKADRPLSHFNGEHGRRIWRSKFAGKEAGHVRSDGYLRVCVGGKMKLGHRIICEMVKGPIPPEMQIDHVNGVRSDNRLCNLRPATHSQNKQNSKRQRNNTSGYKGVTWCKKMKMWRAQIMINGKHKHLGFFSTEEEAYAEYCVASAEIHGEFGRVV